MATLGSIYSDDDGDDQSAGGRDLHASVQIPRDRLGEPTVVEVPLELTVDGQLVPRAIGPGEEGPTITLNLPESAPERVRLRLRRQGEAVEGGRAGDLYIDVRIVEPQGLSPSKRRVAIAAGVVAVAAIGALVVSSL